LGADAVVVELQGIVPVRVSHPAGATWPVVADDASRSLGPVAIESDGISFRLVATRAGAGSSPFGRRERGLFHELTPHFRRALGIRARVDAPPADDAMGAAADMLATGILVLKQGQTVFANREARRILDQGDALHLTRSGLRATDGATDRELRRRMAAASRPRSALPAAALAAHRSTSPAPYLVRVLSVRGGDPFEVERMVAVLIVDPDRPAAPSPDDLCTAFGLSAAQARIATRLCRGETLKAAAGGERIALETARVHLKAAFRKTGTHRQSELIARILDTFPALMRALLPPLAAIGDVW
jgi:DNA-binding CsgD family transcriptional regulator